MKNTTNQYQVAVGGTSTHITRYNRIEEFSTYEAAVTYFQEMCDMILGFYPEVNHSPSNEIELNEGGIGYDYTVCLNFINQ